MSLCNETGGVIVVPTGDECNNSVIPHLPLYVLLHSCLGSYASPPESAM